jgi:NAD(P)-dependent dehydrogenase (short-subunit alcohol dehydrogenase family)
MRVRARYEWRMTHKQHPLGAPFTAFSTVDDVIDGIDLAGKNAIVTGGHGRLGLVTTRTLARAGANVIVASRDVERARRVVGDIPRVEVSDLDLAEPTSIAAFVARFLESKRRLHILVNCAIAPVTPTVVRDARGFEMQFAVGHLGHFALTLGLRSALVAARGARVVNVSSGAHRMIDIRWDDPSFETGYAARVAYAQTKKANVLFAVELDRRWSKDAVRAYAVHPGVVVDPMPQGGPRAEAYRKEGLLDERGQPIIDPARGKKTPDQGASTIVFAATSPLLDDVGGVYLKDNDIARLDDENRPLTAEDIPSEACSSSVSPASATRLWDLSKRMALVPGPRSVSRRAPTCAWQIATHVPPTSRGVPNARVGCRAC